MKRKLCFTCFLLLSLSCNFAFAKVNLKKLTGVITEVPLAMEKFTVKMLKLGKEVSKVRKLITHPNTSLAEIQKMHDDIENSIIGLEDELDKAQKLQCFKLLDSVSKECGSNIMIIAMSAPNVGQLPAGVCSKIATVDLDVASFFARVEKFLQNATAACDRMFDRIIKIKSQAGKVMKAAKKS